MDVLLGGFAVLMAVIGAGQVFVGLRGVREMRERAELRVRALPVAARVTASVMLTGRTSDGDHLRSMLTTVQFEDRLERTHTVQVSLPRLTRAPKAGSTLDIVYDPLDPTTVLPAARGGESFATVVAGFFVVLGVAVVVAAGALALVLTGVLDAPGGLGVPDSPASIPGLDPDLP